MIAAGEKTHAFLYHASPLHYLPQIVQDRALYAKSVLAPRGILPRSSAVRRDRMLGLADYVHLSLDPDTPLLADKLARGYPHVLLEFCRTAVLTLPEVALLPYNTKAWRDKASFLPITDPDEQHVLLQDHHSHARCPSLEVLVKYGLGFEGLTRIFFADETECAAVTTLFETLGIAWSVPSSSFASLFPLRSPYLPVTRARVLGYFDACRAAGSLLPPPEIPFD